MGREGREVERGDGEGGGGGGGGEERGVFNKGRERLVLFAAAVPTRGETSGNSFLCQSKNA